MKTIHKMRGSSPFPIVEGTATKIDSTGVTKTINLPANIGSGDLIIIMMSIRQGHTITNWDLTKDFTELFQKTVASNITLAVGSRVADGTEGSTVDVTISDAVEVASIAYRISGGNVLEAATASGTSTDPNPPNLSPAWGTRTTLWLVAVASNDVTTVDPTNYINGVGEGAGLSRIRSAERELTASSENPGVFTATSDDWAAATIAIRPS